MNFTLVIVVLIVILAAVHGFKKGMIKEYYNNELESDQINNETIIYSKSLTEEKIQKWNNKFLGLTAQSEKEKI